MMLSIIVPVFNTGKYLNECLESLYRQNISDFEVICVDDGSTDNSIDILCDFAERKGNISIIRQEHCGVSAARNKGLNAAKGEYVYFIDSDDYLDDNCLSGIMRKCIENRLDLICFSFNNFSDDDKYSKVTSRIMGDKSRSVAGSNKIITGKELLCSLVFANEWYNSSCIYIARRSVINAYGIKFNDDLICSEDFPFSVKVHLSAERAMCVNSVGYNRRIRQKSIIHTEVSSEFLYCVFKSILMVYNEYHHVNLDDNVSCMFSKLIQNHLLYFAKRYSKASEKDRKGIYSLLSSDEKVFYDCFFVPYVETRDKLLKARAEIKHNKAITQKNCGSQGVLKRINSKFFGRT